jgi:hypothetical protein
MAGVFIDQFMRYIFLIKSSIYGIADKLLTIIIL